MTTRKQRQHHASSRKIDHKSKQKKGLPAVAKDPPKRNKDSEEQDKIVSSSTSAPTSAAQSFHGSRPVPPQVKDKKAGLQGAARNKHHAMKSKVMKKPTNNRKDREHEDSDSDVGELEKGKRQAERLERESSDSDSESDSKDGTSEESSDSDSDEDDDSVHSKDAPVFSDQNKAWLKPKKPSTDLLESDEEDDSEGSDSESESLQDLKDKKPTLSSHHDDDDDEDDGDDDGEDDLLEIEREARLVDQELQDERDEAEEELQRTIRDHTSVYHLPTQEELLLHVDRVVPPSEIRSHIDSILEVLAEFKQRREPGRSRKEYVDLLGGFIAEQYGYLPELVDYFLTMFGPAETLEFVEQSDKPRPMVIRTNTLKTRRKDLAAALMKRGVNLDPLASWSKVGLKIMESPVPIGATPEYLSGMYMLQSAASMCSVLALSPEPQEKVLDVSAAPGGKTTYIAQLMRNTGVVLANDLKAERQKATIANLHRLGVKNVIACQHDGRKLGTLFKNRFDRVLLDAPCSGLGVISRDPSVKVQRTLVDVHKCAHLQKELLLAAIDALKYKGTTGGVMVYSTCSVSIAENEEVINYALSKRDIRLVDTGLDFGKPGFTRYQEKRFHPSVALTRRFYPHVHNMDGFFVAKIQKLSDGRPKQPKESESNDGENVEEIDTAIEEDLTTEGNEAAPVESKSKNQGSRKRKHKESNKLKSKPASSKKNPLVSVPPPKLKQKKQKMNAKVTQPRRHRAAADA